jgi:hypothetical protein
MRDSAVTRLGSVGSAGGLMAQDKDFKRLVRARMAETGERYTVARTALRRAIDPSKRDDVDHWIELLGLKGEPGLPNEGFERLQALPENELRRAAVRGAQHTNWRVRRRCAQLLDDVLLTEETIGALTACLSDDHPRVRQAALHSLVCVHCKPDGCALDVRAIVTPLLDDPSAIVREGAVNAFHHHGDPAVSFDDDDTIAMLRRVASTDVSARVRGTANDNVRWKELRRDGETARRALPDELRRKTERHPGKWVAIADGTIISARVFLGQLRRDMKGTGHPDATVVFVDPFVDSS